MKSKHTSEKRSRLLLGIAVVLLSIVGVTALCSALSSCATTEENGPRQLQTATTASNTVAVITRMAQTLPEPIGSGLTLVGAGVLALLGAWMSHIQRDMLTLKNGKPPDQKPSSA